MHDVLFNVSDSSCYAMKDFSDLVIQRRERSSMRSNISSRSFSFGSSLMDGGCDCL
jgi:hypothetical protein